MFREGAEVKSNEFGTRMWLSAHPMCWFLGAPGDRQWAPSAQLAPRVVPIPPAFAVNAIPPRSALLSSLAKMTLDFRRKAVKRRDGKSSSRFALLKSDHPSASDWTRLQARGSHRIPPCSSVTWTDTYLYDPCPHDTVHLSRSSLWQCCVEGS